MSLTGAIEIARTAMTASQVAIQVTGNNMANAATPGYSRQVALMKAIRGPRSDAFQVGRGVGVADVRRMVDEALQKRLWSGISDEFSSAKRVAIFDQLEGTLGELTDNDLSSQLGAFLNTWSEVASVADSGSIVLQSASKLASFVRSLRGDLHGLKVQIEAELDAAVQRADKLLEDIAAMNRTIAGSEGAGGKANVLRDQRDQLIAELSTLVDVTVVEDAQGQMDVLVGSAPVVLAGQSRGLEVERENVDGELVARVIVSADGEPLPVTSGTIGGLLQARDGTIDGVIADLDQLTAQLIFETNKLHATGTNAAGLAFANSVLQVPVADRTRALNDPNNQALADLPFAAGNGGFFVNIKNADTGSTDQVWVDVDLDGLTNAGVPGFDDDTSAEDIRASLDAVDGIAASWSADGRLTIEADPGFSFSFSDDSSGALGVLGVNAVFTGVDAATIDVRQDLLADPRRLTLGRIVDGQFVENATALRVAGLLDQRLEDLGDRTLGRFWSDRVQGVATAASTAQSDAQAAAIVRQSLETQNAAVSGVSIDEESINLLNYQRQFQAAAQLITVADELLDTLLGLI